MSQPWFPFWVGDYVRDTARLSTEGHGAYLLLMLDYWANGAPPDDDETLASIARLPVEAWLKLRHKLEPFFDVIGGSWVHGRIEKELKTAEEKHEKRVTAGKAGGDAKAKLKPRSSNATAMPPAMPYQSQSQSLKGGGVEAPRPPCPITEEAFHLATEVVQLTGRDKHDPICVGAPLTVQGWFNAGWNADCIKIGVQRGMQSRQGQAPSTLKYFEKAIARAHAELSPSVPVATIIEGEKFNVQAARPRSESLSDVARRQAAAGITFGPRPTGMPADTGDAEGGTVVRLLPQG